MSLIFNELFNCAKHLEVLFHTNSRGGEFDQYTLN